MSTNPKNKLVKGSTPNLEQMNPNDVEWQMTCLDLLRGDIDYGEGIVHEILLSGSIGSAKSILMAHIAITHCLKYSNAKVLLGRNSMPRLKDTILQKVLDHMKGTLKKGVHYTHNKQSGKIEFWNGAEIYCISWHDKDYQKFRSYEFSIGLIEELTENSSEECKEFHTEMIGRIGRINPMNSNVGETFVIYATNPSDPSHWAYDYFIKGAVRDKNYSYMFHKGTRHVLYSLTVHNRFLPKTYIGRLMETYDAKMILRLLKGQWIYIKTDVVYYEYDSQKHYRLRNTKPHTKLPIRISFDFNIGVGKPMSSVSLQFHPKNKKFIFLDEVVVEGSRTSDQMDEWAAKGTFDLPHNPQIIIHGDETGKHNDTRSVDSDYDIIKKFLANYRRKDGARLEFDFQIPTKNPPIRSRHNIMNGQLCDATGKIHVQIDKRCETLDEGFSKTKLKEKGKFIEDDSALCPYQHITTAASYAVYACIEDVPLEDITQR